MIFPFSGSTNAHPYGLFLGGLDVLKEPATPSRYGVPIDSINVTEAGPGGISTLSFSIDDPSLLITIDTTCEVIYWDFTRDVPMFGGYIDRVKTTNDFGDQGRSYEIMCSGFETLLDTCVIDALTVNFTTAVYIDGGTGAAGAALQEPQVLGLLAGFSPLRHATQDTTDTALPPTRDRPVAIDMSKVTNPVTLTFTGMSIRQAYELWLQNVVQATNNLPFIPPVGYFANADSDVGNATQFLTVDFYKGVRWHQWMGFRGNGSAGSVNYMWTDYTTLVITDTPTGTPAEGLTYETDSSPSAIVNGTYVTGTAAAGTGWVGTGLLPRREQNVSGTSTTTESKRALAATVMTQNLAPAGRGSFQMTTYTPVNGIHPGSPLTITDARQGWTSKGLVITQITKTMNSDGTQNWTIDFLDPNVTAGGAAGPPSAMRLARTLTRGTD